MSTFQRLWQIMVYCSVATLLAEAAALIALYARGAFTPDRLVQLMAVSQDVDMAAMWHQLELQFNPPDVQIASYEEVVNKRMAHHIDLDMRELAIGKGLHDIRQLDTKLEVERAQYAQLKASFDRQMQQLQQGALDESLQNVQRQIESIDARLAKDQILRILDDPDIAPEASMQFVVTIFKGMPLDKRKKIVSEFRNEETEQLNEILRQIRLGVPEVTLIRDTRQRLKEFTKEKQNDQVAAR